MQWLVHRTVQRFVCVKASETVCNDADARVTGIEPFRQHRLDAITHDPIELRHVRFADRQSRILMQYRPQNVAAIFGKRLGQTGVVVALGDRSAQRDDGRAEIQLSRGPVIDEVVVERIDRDIGSAPAERSFELRARKRCITVATRVADPVDKQDGAIRRPIQGLRDKRHLQCSDARSPIVSPFAKICAVSCHLLRPGGVLVRQRFPNSFGGTFLRNLNTASISSSVI